MVTDRIKKYLRAQFSEWRSLLSAIIFGALGAVFFSVIGFPSAPLTGAAAAVAFVSLCGVKTQIPMLIRNVALLFLGVNIGTSVTPDMVKSALTWPLSIAVLMLSLISSIWLIRGGLERYFNFNRENAGLSAIPGHASFVLALSLERDADTSRIVIVQSVRVLCITLLVPPIIALGFGSTGLDVLPSEIMSPLSILVTFVITFVVGVLFTRVKLPAGFLLAGMFVSAGLHLSELAPGRLPDALSFGSFLVMGTLIGSRFSGQKWRDVGEALSAGIYVTTMNFAVAFLGAALVWTLLDVPLAQILIAFVPGGVEAMAAIAVMLGIDPTFVAAHHIARLLLLTLLIPLVLQRNK